MNKKKIIIIIVLSLSLVVGVLYYLMNNETKETTVRSEETYITVIVKGEVLRRGTYQVPSTWDISDLLEMVGTKDSANLEDINKKERLVNGETYDIPSLEKAETNKEGLININTADINELMTINGIGIVLANRIVEYRSKTKFKNIEEIKNVTGIGDSLFNKIKDYITV